MLTSKNNYLPKYHFQDDILLEYLNIMMENNLQAIYNAGESWDPLC